MLGTFGAWFDDQSVWICLIRCDRDWRDRSLRVIAVVVEKFVMQRIVGAPPETGVLATLGIALVLQNTVILVFGGGYKFFSGGYIEPVSIFGFTLAEQRVLIIIVCILVFVGLELMVTYSRMGKADARGVAEYRVLRGGRHRRAPGGASDIHPRRLPGGIVRRCLTAPVNVGVYGGMGEIITFETLPVIISGRAWQRPRHLLRGDDPRHRGKPGGDLCRPSVPRHCRIRNIAARY